PLNQTANTGNDTAERRAADRFFAVGGVIPAGQDCYVRRAADDELFHHAINGDYAHVFAPRQMGKSSLCARVAERLRERERLVAVVDLAQIGGRDAAIDSARWFYSFAFRLVRQLRLKVDLQTWWQDKATLTNRQRLTELYWDIILENTQSPVTIFVDSPHAFATLPFAGDLLESIHAAQTARAAETAFGRLNFILLSIAGAARRPTGTGASVFSASQQVALEPFTPADLNQILPALGLPRQAAERAVARVQHWANGQPYLTMKLARAVARRSGDRRKPEVVVDDCVRQLFGHVGAMRSEPHLNAMQQAILGAGRDTVALLNLYGRIRKGERVQYDAESRPQRRLINEGLLSVAADGTLGVSNRLYALLFTTRWVNEHLPVNWRSASLLVAALALVFVLPIWYTQYLPSDWIATMRSPVGIQEAADAHERMRAWPGHRGSANELFATTLTERSRAAGERAAVMEYDRLLRELPGTTPLANELLAEYWEREALRDELRGDRDRALLARLSALVSPSPARTRAAAALVSDDYRQLLGALRLPEPIDAVSLSVDAERLAVVSGTTVRTWSLLANQPQPVATWEAQALALTPHIERLAVPLARRAGAFRLTLSINHDRLSDLELSLAAPSGRSVRLDLSEEQLSPAGEVMLSAARGGALRELADEAAAGNWTLSLADTLPAITGTLSGWELDFGGDSSYASDIGAGLQLADPVAAAAARLTLSPRGRYLIAAPLGTQSAAQVWDVIRAQPVASLPLAPEDRILGFVIDERVVLVARPVGVAAFALATGDPSWAPPLDSVVRQSALSLNGQFLVVTTAGDAGQIEVFDLIDQRRVGRLDTGIDHVAIAVSDDGRLIAVADADRTVRIWPLAGREPVGELPVDRAVTRLTFDAGRRHLAVTAGELRLWPLARSGAPRQELRERSSAELALDADGTGLLAGGAGSGFRLLNANLSVAEHPVLRHGEATAAVHAELRRAAGVAMTFSPERGTLKLWRVPLPPTVAPSGDRPPPVAALSHDLEWLAFEARSGELAVIAADAGPEELDRLSDTVRYIGHSAPIERVVFSPRAALIATNADDSTVRFWEVDDAKPRDEFLRMPAGLPEALAFSPDESTLAVATGTALELYATATGELVHRWQAGATVRALAYSPGGDLFAGLADGYVARLRWQDSLAAVDRIRVGEVPVTALGSIAGRAVAALADGTLTSLDGFRADLKRPLAQFGAPCRALLAVDDAIVCRAGGWAYRVDTAATGEIRARLLPPQRLYPGLTAGSGRDDIVVLAEADLPSPVGLRFDAADAQALDGRQEELLQRWRQRLGFSPDSAADAAAATAAPGGR
ncbi:MAG: AAA-like domain-containing protein, partial [Pseudomonadota bacterium]